MFRTWLVRILAVATTCFAALVAVEVILQVISLAIGLHLATSGPQCVGSPDVVVYGDSTPFGLGNTISFPSELARLSHLTVVNRSRPGLNSSQVVLLLRTDLLSCSPHRIVMAGVNGNRGIAASSAPLVAFLDADDLWRPEKLAKQVAVLAADPAAGLCYTPARFVDAAGTPLPIRKPVRAIAGSVFARLMRANVIIISSVVVRRRCLDEVGGFDATLPVYGCEDWDLWLRVVRRWPVAVVDEELTLYRRHEANTAWRQVLASALAVVDKWYADPETEREAGVSREAVRALHYWVNAATLAMERRSAALPLVARALREFPPAALSRSAMATFATLLLPHPAVRTLRRLST